MESRRHLDLDAGARRLFEIGQRPDASGMRVVARDLDTLGRLGEIGVPGSASGAGGMLSAADELHHRLFVVYPERHADDAAVRGVLGEANSARVLDEVARATFGIAVIDTLRLRLLGTASLALAQPAVPQDRAEGNLTGLKALGVARAGGRDLLYLASEVPAGLGNLALSTHAVWLHQIDVERLLDPAGGSPVDWSHPVPQCGIVAARESTGVVFRAGDHVALACRQGGAQGLTQGQPLETPGVARVTLRPGATPNDTSRFVTEFFPVSGNMQWGLATVDPAVGRLFVQVDGSATESGVWVFDVASGSWLGLTALPAQYALGGTVGLGVDVARGRVYAVSRPDPEGRALVTLASSRDPTADQGELRAFRPDPDARRRRIVVDPLRHRLFVAATGGWLVLRDTIPAPASPTPLDPDANTIDVAEGARTDVNFLGGAHAYGARLRWVGGSRGVERNTNTFLENPPSELSPNTGGILPPPPAEGTRDLHLARVLHTTLSNGEASARATGGQRDTDNTDADLAGWTTYLRRWGGPDLAASRWPYPVAECADFGGADARRGDAGYGAAVTCERAEAVATGVAVDESFAQGGILRYAQARARTLVARDATRGVVSIAEAEVLGLELAGVAGIGRVATRAETWATGRPARSNGVGAGSSFERVIEDVWVARDGQRVRVCSVCDPDVAAEAINRALGIRARVELPEPEPARAAGTPGGYEALIVRDPFERANEASLNDEADDRRLEVSGLVVTAAADGRTPSRVVINLAGVSTGSHYGIFLAGQTLPGDARPPALPPARSVDAPSALPGFEGRLEQPASPTIGTIAREVADGLRLVLASPARAVRVAALWGFLAAPVILLLRRRSWRSEP